MGSSPADYGHGEPLTGFVVVRLAPNLKAVPARSLGHLADARKLVALGKVLKDFGSPPSQRLLQSVSVEKILELEEKAAKSRLPPLFSLASFWRVDFRKQPGRIEDFLGRLRDIREVAEAYHDSAVAAPVVSPGNDPLFVDQKYLTAAPVGIDAQFAWLHPGGDGAGVSVVDLEMDWNFTHEDLAPRNPVLLWGDREGSDTNRNHGTEALGVMVAADNDLGGIGIAPAASPVHTVSHFLTGTGGMPGTPGHMVDAITQATLAMVPGDILVLEVETARGNVTGWPDHHPVEIKDAEFGAIRLAVSQGFVVVEAAGNGSHDLDAYVSPQGSAVGKRVLNRNDPDFRESGAIMVSAGSKAVPRTRPYFANYGSRVDCHAWGEQVTTSGGSWFGVPPPNQAYTGDFNGTSSATAIIGGAAIVVQGVAQAATGQRLWPSQMQAKLKDPATGTQPVDPPTARIGPMPDLRKILTQASYVPDVYLRDSLGDDGTVPQTGAVGASPDIIVVSQLVADPDAAFGQGSGQENRDDLGVAALAGVDNYIHLRIRNRGTPTAPGTTGTVYWSESATLVMPSDWTAIGTTAPIDVPQGDTLAVTPALAWPANLLPAAGHYCLTAVLDSPLDPAPALPDAMDWMGFLDFIQNQNNVTWRNINVVTAAIKVPPRRLGPLVFAMPGAPDAARRFRFELIQRLPAGVRVALEVPASLAVQLVPDGWQMLHDTKRRVTRAIVPTAPRFWLPTVTLAAAARHRAALVFEMDKGVWLDGHSVIMRQLYEDIEVGRIVWRFVAGGPMSEHATPGRMAGRHIIR